MNELIKSQLEAAGFKVTLNTMDWNTLLSIFFKGTEADPTLDAVNVSLPTQDPVTGLVYSYTDLGRSPSGYNWGWYHNDRIEAAYKQIQEATDPKRIDELFTQIHEISTEDAARVFIAHDMNPRALSPKLTGFVQAQSWFQDLTPIVVNP
jgi:peptide/nickel transport system substrate-binding protein